MKQQKGIALTSLIIYIIVLVTVLGVISIMTSFFYNSVDELGKNVEPSQEYTRFVSFFTKDINKQNAKIEECDGVGNYIVFSDGTQYTFKDEKIYRNKVLIGENISEIKFSYTPGDDEEKDVVSVEYKITKDSELKTNKFTLDN